MALLVNRAFVTLAAECCDASAKSCMLCFVVQTPTVVTKHVNITRMHGRAQHRAALCCHLANATDLLTPVVRTIAMWLDFQWV